MGAHLLSCDSDPLGTSYLLIKIAFWLCSHLVWMLTVASLAHIKYRIYSNKCPGHASNIRIWSFSGFLFAQNVNFTEKQKSCETDNMSWQTPSECVDVKQIYNDKVRSYRIMATQSQILSPCTEIQSLTLSRENPLALRQYRHWDWEGLLGDQYRYFATHYDHVFL